MTAGPDRSRPVIGITADLLPWKRRLRFAAYTNYADCVSEAGGLPVSLPPTPGAVAEYLEIVHGLLIPGGDDIHPRFYGEDMRHRLVVSDERRTVFEIESVLAALDAGVPVLGVCLGCQTMNVALGGTLTQDIPAEVPGALAHREVDAEALPTHDVEVLEGTLLRGILGAARVTVNSSHHQGIARLGQGVVVSARSEDGVVEGIEVAGKTLAVGVQWHPEETPEQEATRRIFRAFVEAAAARRNGG